MKPSLQVQNAVAIDKAMTNIRHGEEIFQIFIKEHIFILVQNLYQTTSQIATVHQLGHHTWQRTIRT